MKAERETDVLKACLLLLKLRGIFAWRSNNAGVYDPARKCFRSFTGLKGIPDILGILPGGRFPGVPGGLFLGVEVKQGKGRLTPEQEHFRDTANRLGALCLCVRSVGELARVLDELATPPPGG